jgi:hypothetical protein
VSGKAVSAGVTRCFALPPWAAHRTPPTAQKNAVLGRRTCERPPHPKQVCHVPALGGEAAVCRWSRRSTAFFCAEARARDAAAGGKAIPTRFKPCTSTSMSPSAPAAAATATSRLPCAAPCPRMPTRPRCFGSGACGKHIPSGTRRRKSGPSTSVAVRPLDSSPAPSAGCSMASGVTGLSQLAQK